MLLSMMIRDLTDSINSGLSTFFFFALIPLNRRKGSLFVGVAGEAPSYLMTSRHQKQVGWLLVHSLKEREEVGSQVLGQSHLQSHLC